VTKDALIIGTNSAALQAALDLADSGVKVNLVESAPFMFKNGAPAVPAHVQNTRWLEIARHPNVTLWTNTRLNRCEQQNGDFKVELRQQPRFVDLNLCTACGACLAVCPVTVPGTDHKVIYVDGQPGVMAIDKLGKPPCSNTCPGGIHVQGYVALIAQGRFQEAIDLIREAIPFPGICGRVCTHPCEINCRRTEIDAPVAVRLLKRFVSDWEIEQGRKGGGEAGSKRAQIVGARPPQLTTPNLKPVAIVGAGPGGMAVADRLARKGYSITVFEKLPVIGGMMAIGIPGYRLPREIIAREYQHIQDLGVEIKLNTAIGPDGDHTLDDLFELGYGAVCLAVGAHKSLSLGIPGENFPGVVHSIEVLKTISLIHQQNDLQYEVNLLDVLRKGTKTRIAVLGGGNTAIDVARSIKRYNVQDVNIFYRRTRAEMPALDVEIEDAEKEGIGLEFLVSPVRILGDETTGVTGLECIRMKLGEPDASGRRRPVPIADSEFVVDLDLVVLAIGQAPNLDFLDADHGIAITRGQCINVAEADFMTSREGVFAVGDAVTRDKMVVIEAIGMGKKAAVAIDAYLQGQQQGQGPDEIVVDAREIPIARRDMTPAELAAKPRVAVPTISLEKRVTSYSEVELGYSAEQAIAEAQRCLACGPCSECQACVQVCKPAAIDHDQPENYANLTVGAIVAANGTEQKFSQAGIFRIASNEAVWGSAIANQVYIQLNGVENLEREQNLTRTVDIRAEKNQPGWVEWPDRLGVFICQCGPDDGSGGLGEISRVIDTELIRDHTATWPGVIHTQTLPISCSPEGAAAIETALHDHKLNRIVLAACSCCSIDQICYSCTFQRVRCKDNLRLFTHPECSSALGTIDRATKFVLVNIREQCAWVHAGDTSAATDKATALIAGSVARAMATPTKLNGMQFVQRSVLIFGNGPAVKNCIADLQARGIRVSQMDGTPEIVQHKGGQYLVSKNGTSWQAAAVVLVPKNRLEKEAAFKAIDHNEFRGNGTGSQSGLETYWPGVYCVDPELDVTIAGAATASQVAAWLNQIEHHRSITSVVNAARCRACGTCIEICEFGAPELIRQAGQRNSWIDPTICTGCGTCVAHCPSGAITAGYSTDAQMEAMLSAILAR